MSAHSHCFVDNYTGLVGFGLDRDTDLATVRVYLQKFSDDQCLEALLPRLDQAELTEVFDLVSRLLRAHFSEAEYHQLFLKESHHEH